MDINSTKLPSIDQPVRSGTGDVTLEGQLQVPSEASGVVIFAHGSGSSRHSPRNQFVARVLNEAHVGTLLFDLLTAEEEAAERYTRHLRFDIGLLANRLNQAAAWLLSEYSENTRLGFFGASTGGGAALVAAAELGRTVNAVVSRGGRPDLAGDTLERVTASTLLIVGELDKPVIGLNQQAYDRLHCEKELRIVPAASHLFEEAGTLEEVARLAAEWFQQHFQND
jgi:putative phosphoribosyl transferase